MTFLEILDDLGVQYFGVGQDKHARPDWVNLECPFCGKGSGKNHMGYSLDKNYVACWKCGGHSLLSTLIELTSKESHECRKLLDTVERFHVKSETETRRGRLLLPKRLEPLSKAHLKYLFDRGFDAERIKLWDLQGLGIGAYVKTPDRKVRLDWRIFIPIKLNGDIVSWTTRTISKTAQPRYISAPAEAEVINHKELLFGEDFCRYAVCCCEGPFDAMAIGPGAVATCGTSYSSAQVNRLSNYLVRGICFDNEPEAQRRARRLMESLNAYPGETINIVLKSKDPGEASEKEIRQIRKTLAL